MSLVVDYALAQRLATLPADVIAAIGFGADGELPEDSRCIRVGLLPTRSPAPIELWRASGPVACGTDGSIRYARTSEYLAGVIELVEDDWGGLSGAAEAAYRQIAAFSAASPHSHVLRMWNYLDAINEGAGDAERYRQFCMGRARGIAAAAEHYPAATAIGRRDGNRRLQVYWLAARTRGRAFENPRQLSAYRYPRAYGPRPPAFSRAMVSADSLLFISGTASIVGHHPRHAGNLRAQFDETLRNLDIVLGAARGTRTSLAALDGHRGLLKVYLRDAAAGSEFEAWLHERIDASHACMILAADICRSDLELEIEYVHTPCRAQTQQRRAVGDSSTSGQPLAVG